jgi:hypothetical protein
VALSALTNRARSATLSSAGFRPLGAAIDGDALAAARGQLLQACDHSTDQRAGAAIRVGEQNSAAGPALEQRGQVGLAVLAPEEPPIGFPVAEGPALGDLARPLLDGALGWDERGARLAAVAR